MITFSDHWCLLEHMTMVVTDTTNGDINIESFGPLDGAAFIDLFDQHGLIIKRSFKDNDFCTEHKIEVTHDGTGPYPDQQVTISTGSSDKCWWRHCTLKSVDVEFN